jgi:hypothetical protein
MLKDSSASKSLCEWGGGRLKFGILNVKVDESREGSLKSTRYHVI